MTALHEDIRCIGITRYGEYAADPYEAYILPDARLVSAEDATDDEWALLPEYAGYYSIVRSDDGLASYLVHRDDVHYACIESGALSTGWGYHEPESGDRYGLEAGEPAYQVQTDDGILYLT